MKKRAKNAICADLAVRFDKSPRVRYTASEANMFEAKLRKREFRQILRLSLLCGGLSSVVSAAGAFAQTDLLLVLINGLIGLLIGFLTPFLLQVLSVFAKVRLVRIRRAPRLLVILLHALLTMAVVALLNLAYITLLYLTMAQEFAWLETVNISLKYSLTIAAVLGLVMSSYITMQEFLGRHFLRDLFLGRYAAPIERSCAIAFVDLSGSTTLADTLSAPRFFGLLNDYLGMVETVAHYHEGNIYKYLGDGVIVTWNLPKAGRKPIDFMVSLEQELLDQQRHFRSTYGVGISCTAGLHAGKVLIGEIGRERKELGYWGDTVNTAQRVQATCKRAATRLLVSQDYLELSQIDPRQAIEGYRLLRLDQVRLPGKKTLHTLFALRREGLPEDLLGTTATPSE